ncbi:MAG: UbiA family prenyltransferase [Kiritimatiellae bacterium]|nr:UbiA family prenyltransferase [Kiritimatiellia bacterium]MDW8459351.1 UbiA family prenyltransferase [Verrucomicrobiota bacterium]
MRSLNAYLALLRPGSWIKNVFIAPGVLLAVYFGEVSDSRHLAPAAILAFVCACLTASSNYVINQIFDAEGDSHHPDKRYRPLPSGRIARGRAWVLWAALGMAGLSLAAQLGRSVFASCALLWLMGLAYNVPPVRLKDLPYVDALAESINNPIRLAIGWYAFGASRPPTLSALLSSWMLGAFLMTSKRIAEFRRLGNPAAEAYRKSFRWYSEPRLLVSAVVYAALFGMFAGVFISRYRMELVLGMPFVGLAMAAYFRSAFQPNSPAMNPEKIWSSPSILVTSSIAFVICAILLFLDVPEIAETFAPQFPLRAIP